jgi:hypothetical protein
VKVITTAVMASLLTATLLSVGVRPAAAAATPPQLALRVLLIGDTATQTGTTAAWQSTLSSDGVAYTTVMASGGYGAETVTLPALSSGSVGNFNGVVIADAPAGFAPGQLNALFSYESTFGVRQIDGAAYPSPALGQTAVAGASQTLDNTTASLTAAGLAGLPGLKGIVPFAAGTFGTPATADAGAPFTPWIENTAGQSLGGVYQHPGVASDLQAGVSELSLNFNYNANQLQWLLLAPGLIDWVTQDTHLGLFRNYFGQDVDDVFIADNEWSSQYQCTPSAADPPDYTCPTSVQNATQGSAPGVPADVQMSAADVAYVTSWEAKTGIKLNLAFNAIGACTTKATASTAVCTGSVTENGAGENGKTYTDPGHVTDVAYPDDAAFVNALLGAKSNFNWVTHTWSHQFLGCTVWQPQALTSVTPNASGGSFTAGNYSYEITAATAYGESEPSLPQTATVAANGSVTLSWPDATNGVGTDGTPGPTLAQEEADHDAGTGTGFWGYDIYRENLGDTTPTYGLVGQVAENGTQPTYSYTDTGATTPGDAPGSSDAFPTATNPGIDCSSAPGSWDPSTDPSTTTDASIGTEIGWDQAFAAANGLPNYTPAAVVTGEHSGLENPNMTSALAGVGVTTFASDASRQSAPFTLGAANSAPRYPSNIYYNADNWADELNEYNTLYASTTTQIGTDPLTNPPTKEYGHCTNTSSTTCLTTPATQASLIASETGIMMSHILANNPRVDYAHQSNLIGPEGTTPGTGGYTLLDTLSAMQTLYNSYENTNAPLDQMTDVTEAQVLAQQKAWATADTANSVTATLNEATGAVTVTNTSGAAVDVPVTTPQGTTVGGAAYGQSYAGQLSAWTSVAPGTPLVLDEHVAPNIISANTATSTVGVPFSTTVTTTGEPTATLTETGALPTGITFTDNGNGTATLAGTAAAATGGSFPITITATNPSGTVTQAFTLTNDQAPAVTSLPTASFYTGVQGLYTVTTTGYPVATITETGALPAGLAFADKGDGTATITGATTATSGTFPVSISAKNSTGSTATLPLTITVSASGPPTITSGATAFFTLGQAGAFAVTSSGGPVPVVTEVGALPDGLTMAASANGSALVSGTPTATGTTQLAVTAANGQTPDATQTLTIIVGSAPTVTSPAAATFFSGTSGSFTVTTAGYPAPSLGETGALPNGITWTDNGNGTATFSGTPDTVTSDTDYPITLQATDGTGSVTQPFTLTVAPAPLTGGSIPPVGTPPVTSSTGPTSALAGGDRLASTPDGQGYWIVGLNGSVTPYGDAGNYGSMDGHHLNKPIVGVAATPDGKGYWLVASDGGIFSFGDAQFYGSTGNIRLNQPIVGITSTTDGHGYWMVASDGGVFSFGDALFHGSTGNIKLNKPIVGMASTPDGNGYWLVASDGGIFSFGDAGFHGSTGNIKLNKPVMGMAADRTGHGYWLVASDGGIFTFGDAGFYGSGGSAGRTAVGLIASPGSPGYALIDLDGTRTNFGW